MNKNEFEIDLEIDPNQLDVCAGMQGEVFFKWAEKSARARRRMDDTKFRLEILYANLAKMARRDPASFGLTKSTENSIENAVKTSVEYSEGYEEWIQARYASNLADRAVEAMEQRKRMIEVLITLHGQQYFAGPSVPRSLTDAWQNSKEEKERRIKSKTIIRKRKKKGPA